MSYQAEAVERRIAQGIEITSREIRLVRLSYVPTSDGTVPDIHVDDAVRYPLMRGLVAGTDIVDAAGLARALGDCLVRQAARLAGTPLMSSQGADDTGGERDTGGAGELSGAGARGGADHLGGADDGEYNVDDRTHGDRDAIAASGGVGSARSRIALALALCPSVVTQRDVALDELMPGFNMRLPGVLDDAAFDALEPWVLLYAQKMTGIDPSDLAFDWYRSTEDGVGRLTVAAAQKHYLDVRQRVVEEAGATLAALGDASIAALGACRFVVARSLHVPGDGGLPVALYPSPVSGARFAPASSESPASSPCREDADAADEDGDALETGNATGLAMENDRHRVAEARRAYSRHVAQMQCIDKHLRSHQFAALWIGEAAWRAWTFDPSGTVLSNLRLPEIGDAAAMLAKLRASAPPALALVLVAGERELLEPAGGMRALSDALACPAIEFDASTCCVGPGATPQQLGPAASVAFGLALHELMR